MTVTSTESGILCCTFNDVLPVNTVEEGIASGHYTDHYNFITNKTVPLKPAKQPKNIHLVGFNRTIGEKDWEGLLKTEGKQPCENAPNYLLGLMTQVPEVKMPEEIRNKYIVAANHSSVFTDLVGFQCFLYVGRGVGYRELYLADVVRRWRDSWLFVAEDLVP